MKHEANVWPPSQVWEELAKQKNEANGREAVRDREVLVPDSMHLDPVMPESILRFFSIVCAIQFLRKLIRVKFLSLETKRVLTNIMVHVQILGCLACV